MESAVSKDIPALVIGAGPAGLMAAEQLSNAGISVCVVDAMPSPGRKFLRAGIGGLNLTHSESPAEFVSRYSEVRRAGEWLRDFDASAVRRWASDLGIETFIGSSGRIFPVGLKAAPLLRAWLARLRRQGLVILPRHRWRGFLEMPGADTQSARVHLIETPEGSRQVRANVVIFALGGGSWARLGSDGLWMQQLADAGIACTPLQPANCGFDYAWSDALRGRHAGAPLKSVGLSVVDAGRAIFSRRGEALISRHGVQGGLIYAASRTIRKLIEKQGEATIHWDLLPDSTEEQVAAALSIPRGRDSVSNWLRKRLGLDGVRLSLLYELGGPEARAGRNVAGLVKRLPQILRSPRPLDEAISTDGGVSMQALDDHLMSVTMPGVFFAGEMLDWDAPTGGYLLTACLASGRVAGQGALAWLRRFSLPAAFPDDHGST